MSNALNLTEINQEQALALTKFFIKANKNIFLFGRRGTGKSEIVIRAIKECNYKINYINLSVVERPDLAGFPNMNDPGDVVTFKSPSFLPKLIENSTPDTVILFDEVDKAAPEITAPLLEILQFRKINGNPINVAACVLTGNLLNEGAYSNTISTALLDRGAKYILQFDFDQWIDWAKANDMHDLILGFLRSNVDFAIGKVDDNCYASPSPRGWTLASEAIIKSKELKITDINTVTQIISGFVGAEAGLKFKIWYEYYKSFEPFVHSIIDTGSMNFDYNELMPTEKIVFAISACYYAKQKTLSETNNKFLYLENLCKFFSKYKVDIEMIVIALNNAFTFDMITLHNLYKCKVFFDLFYKLNKNMKL